MVEKRPIPTSIFWIKAAFLAFQALVPSVKGPHICFGIDNRTAMSHMNKLGGHSVSNTVKSSSRIMELCSEQKPDNFSHPHSREAKCQEF